MTRFATRTRQMTPTEAAWLAGFFDGEGTIYNYVNASSGQHALGLSLAQCHFDSLQRCKDLTGVGSVKPIKLSILGKKPAWKWRVSAWNDVKNLLEQMLPYLVVKHELAERCIDAV